MTSMPGLDRQHDETSLVDFYTNLSIPVYSVAF